MKKTSYVFIHCWYTMRWVETKEESKKFTPMKRKLPSPIIDVKSVNEFVLKK